MEEDSYIKWERKVLKNYYQPNDTGKIRKLFGTLLPHEIILQGNSGTKA